MSSTVPTHHRTKKHAGANKKSRTALAPIAVTNNAGRDDGRRRIRRATRSSRVSGCTVGGGAVNTGTGGLSLTQKSSTLRVAAGVRDGRRKPVPHRASVPALPVVPGWKAMAAGGTERVENRKRTRRRPPNRAAVAGAGLFDAPRGGATWATEDFDGILKARNSTADLERLLSTSAGGGGGGVSLAPAADNGGKIRALRRNRSSFDENAGAEENLDTNSGVQQPVTNEVHEAEAASGESEGQEQESHHLAGDECLSMETLDSAFPVPEDGAESGGGGGLGETSAPGGGFMSPGWSSRSSRRSSEEGETSSDALSDSTAIRQGKALLSGESDGPASGWGRSSAGGGVDGDAEESAAAAAAAERVQEHPTLLPPVEAESESGAAADDHGRPPGVLVQLPSAAFPDSVSDMSDNRTFIDQQLHDDEESGD